jgi:hypothetical protein
MTRVAMPLGKERGGGLACVEDLSSAFPTGAMASRADVIRKTTSSWSAPSYIPESHDGSAGLACAKGMRMAMHTDRIAASTEGRD